jgi:cytochrome c oxidase assembly protein subunit 15
MCFAVIFMIFIGGLTRLTDSGLSITEWNPVTGVLPPLDSESWETEFGKYQQSPEYIKYNSGMSLDEFKPIYLLEFYHRIAGRFTALLYLIPLIFFITTGKINKDDLGIYVLALILLACQGVMGWYMVKSGLISDPHVSHYRLAAHLLLAVFLYTILFWQLMKNLFDPLLLPVGMSVALQKFWCFVSIALLLVQIVFGAFVAGLKAGFIHNYFPMMGDEWIANSVAFTFEKNGWISLLENQSSVQFIHRYLAYIVAAIALYLSFVLTRKNHSKTLINAGYLLAAMVVIQFLLGVFTLIYAVTVSLGVIHQAGAFVLLGITLYVLKIIYNKEIEVV